MSQCRNCNQYFSIKNERGRYAVGKNENPIMSSLTCGWCSRRSEIIDETGGGNRFDVSGGNVIGGEVNFADEWSFGSSSFIELLKGIGNGDVTREVS